MAADPNQHQGDSSASDERGLEPSPKPEVIASLVALAGTLKPQ